MPHSARIDIDLRGPRASRHPLLDQVATLSQVFVHVHVLPAEDDVWGGEANYLLLAMDGPTTFEGTIPYDEDFLGAVQWD